MATKKMNETERMALAEKLDLELDAFIDSLAANKVFYRKSIIYLFLRALILYLKSLLILMNGVKILANIRRL